MTDLIWTVFCLLAFIVGLVVGAWWNSRPISDLEKREIHHTRHDDEHAIGYPEDSKMKSPDDWPRGGL